MRPDKATQELIYNPLTALTRNEANCQFVQLQASGFISFQVVCVKWKGCLLAVKAWCG